LIYHGPMSFNPHKIKVFRFVDAVFNQQQTTARLSYALDDQYHFTETVVFHGANTDLSKDECRALQAVINQLHLIAGISYYKTCLPEEIRIENQAITKSSAEYFESLYLHGLGEFAFKNRINLSGKIKFPYSPLSSHTPSFVRLPARTVIPVGGGKDSVVTLEALKDLNIPLSTIAVGGHPAIKAICELAGYPHLAITRHLSPNLFQLNSDGALNGHVPVTAILGFIFAAAAILYGFNTIIMSNERSANIGNTRHNGVEVNHQYSKSLDFERKFQKYIQTSFLPDLQYFSLLRPLSELSIAKLFSSCSKYHDTFTSCNAAFRIHSENPVRWCRSCPKCRFVFLTLAPFIKKDKLISIFGDNLLNNQDQVQGFEDLLSKATPKPFECVGEPVEAQAAMILLLEQPEWQNDIAVKYFQENYLTGINNPGDLIKQVLSFSDDHLLSEQYRTIIYEYSRS
jgi:UDP-N-acetyl-alpha-D-muramoyl-L-alanyl-L-glutamate epimerase